MTSWQALHRSFSTEMADAINLLHQSAQFLPMFSHAYLERQADDSHNNLLWQKTPQGLAGQSFNEYHWFLSYSEQRLELQKEGQKIAIIELAGQTSEDALKSIQASLSSIGLDTSIYKALDHFEIPDHPVKQGKAFQSLAPSIRKELIAQRQNAQNILEAQAVAYPHAQAVRIWPHHFDTGCYIPIRFNPEGAAEQSFSLGWAIPDEQIPEPYYYITHWNKEGHLTYDQLPELKGGGRWNRQGWTGAVLLLSDILAAGNEQQQAVEDFMSSGIAASLQLLETAR